MSAPVFTPREVAELSGAPRHVIEKAIEEGVLRARLPSERGNRRRRMLPSHAIVYAALISKLGLRLTVTHKKRLLRRLKGLKSSNLRKARIELAPAVAIDLGYLVGDVLKRAERYRVARDKSIQIDEAVMGGTPVIRRTRITVYSVLGRIEHGETIEDILADNPDLSRKAVEAAVIYARTHPLMGRPIGR